MRGMEVEQTWSSFVTPQTISSVRNSNDRIHTFIELDRKINKTSTKDIINLGSLSCAIFLKSMGFKVIEYIEYSSWRSLVILYIHKDIQGYLMILILILILILQISRSSCRSIERHFLIGTVYLCTSVNVCGDMLII